MKKLIYSFLILALPTFSLAGDTDFSYDKSSLISEFSQLDKVADYVDETNVSYTELSNSPVFEGNIELTNAIAVKPNLKFEDVDWGAFAWGFCCWPIGIFTVILKDDVDKNSKNSFFAGIASATIATTVSYIAVYVIAIASYSGF
jgi:hypothetical protein